MRDDARRRDVQGLRAIAVLYVVMFHAGLSLPGGFTGVDMFFVISGFVITGTLTRERAASGRLDIVGFYVRRIKRLLPGLAVMLVSVALLGILASPVSSVSVGADTGAYASLFAANVYLHGVPGGGYFDPDASLNPLLHTWTLGVEEQFYVVFALLLLVGWTIAGRGVNRTAIVLVVVFTAASLALTLRASPSVAFYGSPARAWEFGAGALMWLLAPAILRLPRRVAVAVGVLGVAALVVTAARTAATDPLPGAALLAVVGTCAVLVAGTATSTGASRLLAAPPFVWIGDRSYGWYLWHWPLIVFATALWPLSAWAPPAAAALALLAASLSLRHVENPFRFDPRIQGRKALALGAVCITLPLIACLAWRAAVQHLVTLSPALAAVERSRQPHVGQTRGCYGVFKPASPATAGCTWPIRRSHGSAVLLGDSVATSLTGAFVTAAHRAGLDAISATLPGCAFLDLVIRGGLQTEEACRRYYLDSMRELVRFKPTVVVVATTSTYVRSEIEPDTISLLVPGTSGRATRADQKAALWAAARASLIMRLNAAGVPVLLVMPTPITAVTPSECAVLRALTRSCQGTRSRAAVDRERAPMLEADRRVVAGSDAASLVDFIDDVCGRDDCETTRANTVLYQDRVHLSVAGARMLSDHFADAIRRQAG